MSSRLRIACLGMVACLALSAAAFPGLSAGEARADADAVSAKEAFQKTYKRRCTNSKCKQVSESTKPIFKCPFCGSSTVPMN